MLRAIDNLVADLGGKADQFCSRNFALCEGINDLPNNPLPQKAKWYEMTEEAALVIVGRMTGSTAAKAQVKLAQAFVDMKRVIKNQRLADDRQLRLQLEAVQDKANTLEQILESKANTLAKLLNIAPSKTRPYFQQLVEAGLVTEHTKEIHGFTYKPTDKGLDFVQHVDKNGIIHWKDEAKQFLLAA